MHGYFYFIFFYYLLFSQGFFCISKKSVIELDVTYDQETLNITSNSSYEEQVKAKFFRIKEAIANALPDLSKKRCEANENVFCKC